jgi:hypothetical protein
VASDDQNLESDSNAGLFWRTNPRSDSHGICRRMASLACWSWMSLRTVSLTGRALTLNCQEIRIVLESSPSGEALHQLPRLEQGGGAAQSEAPKALADLRNFSNTIESLREVTDVNEAISRHTAPFARVLIAHPELMPVPLVHTITAPAAMRSLLSFFDEGFGVWSYSRIWQVSSAILALFAKQDSRASELEPKLESPRLARDELIGRAIEHRDRARH